MSDFKGQQADVASMADLHDADVKNIGIVWKQIMDKWSTRANTRHNLEEMAKEAHDAFLKVGLIVDVNVFPCLIVDPWTQQTGQPIITILGHVEGTQHALHPTDDFDHERKRHDVLKANELGEDFRGQKES